MAAPNPEIEIERLRKTLTTARKSGGVKVLVLSGPERWFRDRALSMVRKALAEGGDLFELDASEREGSTQDAASFLMDLRTSSLFGGNKVLVLRSAEKWLRSHGKVLAETLDKIADGNVLVLELAKLDGRTALARKLAKSGERFEFRRLYESAWEGKPPASAEIVQWAMRRAKGKKLGMSADVALFLVQVVGSEASQLEGALEQLGLTHAGQTLTGEDLRSVLTVSFGSSQFELCDAILAKDSRAALRSLRALYREGLRDKDGKKLEAGAIFPMVTSWLASSLEKLSNAREELAAGAPVPEVVRRYGGPFQQRFERQLRGLDIDSLRRMRAALLRAEERLRGSGEEPEVLLERLIAESCLPIRSSLLGSGDLRAW
jgi:DNA polymerase III delta subunit